MRTRYMLLALLATSVSSFCALDAVDAHGPARTSGGGGYRRGTPATRAAMASQYAAQYAAQNSSAQAVAQNNASLYGGAAVQQSTLPIRQSSAIASQLVGNNAAISALASQIAAQNPRLSAQQANEIASQDVSNYVAQQRQLASQTADLAAQSIKTPAYRQAVLNSSGQYVPVQAVTPTQGGGSESGGISGSGGVGDSVGISGGAETAPALAMQGTAQTISAAGQYDLNTSTAALNLAEAEKREMRNQVQAIDAYWEMRRLGRTERASELGPRPSSQEIALRAHIRAPRNLGPNEIDPVSGTLFWPAALQDDVFQENRLAVSDIAAKWVRYGGLTYDERTQASQAIHSMVDTLKSRISQIPPQEYVACRTFLERLLYGTTQALI